MELAIKVVKERYVNGKSVDEVCRTLELDYPALVTRLIVFARKNNLFSIDFTPKLFSRNEALEKALKNKFGLRGAIVVDYDYEPKEDENSLKVDDELHKALGQTFADQLAPTFEFNTPGSIGVGGGRGPYYFAKALSKSPLQVDTVIKSLTGTISAEVWNQKGEDRFLMLDSRDVTNLLGKALGVKDENLYPLNFPLVCSSVENRKQLLKTREAAYFISDEGWNEQRPDMLVVGIGVIGGGHRFVKHTAFNLMPISDLLDKLISLIKQVREKVDFFPVGDVCNYLFIVNPEKLKIAVPDIYDELDGLVEKINAKLLTINLEQLKSVKNVIGIAGGVQYKAPAIRYVLEENSIDILCTDSKTADYLLKDK